MDGKGTQHPDEKMEKSPRGRARRGKKSGSEWGRSGVVQEVLRVCSVSSGTEVDEPLWARTEGHDGTWSHVEKNSAVRKREIPDRNAEG